MSLSGIIYESITDNYFYGHYGSFTVIMMNSNSYINATKLCSQYGKEFKQWLRNDSGKSLVESVNKHISSGGNSPR